MQRPHEPHRKASTPIVPHLCSLLPSVLPQISELKANCVKTSDLEERKCHIEVKSPDGGGPNYVRSIINTQPMTGYVSLKDKRSWIGVH